MKKLYNLGFLALLVSLPLCALEKPQGPEVSWETRQLAKTVAALKAEQAKGLKLVGFDVARVKSLTAQLKDALQRKDVDKATNLAQQIANEVNKLPQ